MKEIKSLIKVLVLIMFLGGCGEEIKNNNAKCESKYDCFNGFECVNGECVRETGDETEEENNKEEQVLWCEGFEVWKNVNEKNIFVEDCFENELCCREGVCVKCDSNEEKPDKDSNQTEEEENETIDEIQNPDTDKSDNFSTNDDDDENFYNDEEVFDGNEEQEDKEYFQDEENDVLPDNDPVCIPDCNGKNCGSDGCGGTCGTCGSNESCVSGKCESSCECTTGACCDGCNFKPDSFICDTDIERDCVSTSCGGSRKYRDIKKYCSGSNSTCSGRTETGSWTTKSCDSDEKCDSGYCEYSSSCEPECTDYVCSGSGWATLYCGGSVIKSCPSNTICSATDESCCYVDEDTSGGHGAIICSLTDTVVKGAQSSAPLRLYGGRIKIVDSNCGNRQLKQADYCLKHDRTGRTWCYRMSISGDNYAEYNVPSGGKKLDIDIKHGDKFTPSIKNIKFDGLESLITLGLPASYTASDGNCN